MANFKEKNQITAEIILIEDEIVSEALQYNDVKLMRRALERMGLRDNYFTLVRGESQKLGDVLSTASQRVEVVLCVGSPQLLREALVEQVAAQFDGGGILFRQRVLLFLASQRSAIAFRGRNHSRRARRLH